MEATLGISVELSLSQTSKNTVFLIKKEKERKKLVGKFQKGLTWQAESLLPVKIGLKIMLQTTFSMHKLNIFEMRNKKKPQQDSKAKSTSS
jgi:hypothetical protein